MTANSQGVASRQWSVIAVDRSASDALQTRNGPAGRLSSKSPESLPEGCCARSFPQGVPRAQQAHRGLDGLDPRCRGRVALRLTQYCGARNRSRPPTRRGSRPGNFCRQRRMSPPHSRIRGDTRHDNRRSRRLVSRPGQPQQGRPARGYPSLPAVNV